MAGLVLELKQDELLIINGAAIRFRAKCRIEISGKARFLFGKQILAEAEAVTPARRIYLALQTAYIGAVAERAPAVVAAAALIAAYRPLVSSGLAQDMLDRMVVYAQADDCYEALKLARRIIRHEDSLGEPAAESAL